MSTVPHRLFFLGVGGIGMSALARYFVHRGHVVAGYDRTPSPLTHTLEQEGIHVQYVEDPEAMPADFREAGEHDVLLVRTPAVPLDSPLLHHWMQRGARTIKRSELLGTITQERRTLAVAGTHGKTTVSCMLAHLLRVGGVPCNAFLGGIAANYGTNLLLDEDAIVNVVEADEYDRSFLHLHPSEAIITSVDPDHLDIYHTPEAMTDAYDTFADLCSGQVLVHESAASHFQGREQVSVYGTTSGLPIRSENIRIVDGTYRFDLVLDQDRLDDLELGMPGRHNVWNASAASAMALNVGVSQEKLREGLRSFAGVYRRFQVHVKGPKAVYVDDYAHHPVELAAAIGSARELYPGRRITGVFQPHLFSRTRDLAEGFAKTLAGLDRLVLLPIYPAREEPLPGIDAQWLLDQVPLKDKLLITRDEVPAWVDAQAPDVLLTLGAGDIDRLVPDLTRIMQRHAS